LKLKSQPIENIEFRTVNIQKKRGNREKLRSKCQTWAQKIGIKQQLGFTWKINSSPIQFVQVLEMARLLQIITNADIDDTSTWF